MTLESYGYKFLRVNRFNMGGDPVATLSERLAKLVNAVKRSNGNHKVVDRIQNDAAALANGDMKFCRKCQNSRPLKAFFDKTLRSGKGGYGRYCLACKRGQIVRMNERAALFTSAEGVSMKFSPGHDLIREPAARPRIRPPAQCKWVRASPEMLAPMGPDLSSGSGRRPLPILELHKGPRPARASWSMNRRAAVLHEDHPQRALHAARRMQEDLKRYADRLRERGQPPLSVRVGVNSGEVVVRSIQTGDEHTEYTPIGHSISLAARLQTLAAPGSVVIGESVRKFVEGYFQLKALAASRIKGVSESSKTSAGSTSKRRSCCAAKVIDRVVEVVAPTEMVCEFAQMVVEHL
jgi:Adenylate and Guanylate cyclase catalytic domain